MTTAFAPKTCFEPLSMYYIDFARVCVLARSPAEAAHHWVQWGHEQSTYDITVYGSADIHAASHPAASIKLHTGSVLYIYKTPIKNQAHYSLPAGMIFSGDVEPHPICFERVTELIRAIADEQADPVTLVENLGTDIKTMTQYFGIIVGLLETRKNVDRFRVVGLLYELLDKEQYDEFIELPICPNSYFYDRACSPESLLEDRAPCIHCYRYDGSDVSDWE
jgi:hypothetical protein